MVVVQPHADQVFPRAKGRKVMNLSRKSPPLVNLIPRAEYILKLIAEQMTKVECALAYASWNPLLSAFLSGLFVLLGAAIGGWIVFRAQDRQRRSEQDAACRAILAEMQINSKSLVDSIDYPKDRFLYSSSVWLTTLPLVAQRLTWTQLEMVVEA
jgi:hypothetical protein